MLSVTLRLQTPPAAFWFFQYAWLPWVSARPSGANTPDSSVSTPRRMVFEVTPGPVLIPPCSDPPPPPLLPLSELLPQAARARATASDAKTANALEGRRL